MSCTNCKNEIPKTYKENCFEIEGNKNCDPGCKSIVDTDCVFFNTKRSPLLKLPNIGIYDSVALSYLFREIDEKFGQTNIADFSKFNLNGLDVGTTIKTLKQFSEAITLQIKNIKDKQTENDVELEELNSLIEDLSSVVDSLVQINVSNTTLNINSTDDLRTVLNKILSYVEDIDTDNSIEFTDSSTINFTSSGGNFIAESIINPAVNNIIKSTDEGLYATYKPTSETLNDVKNSNVLQDTFNSLVKFPPFIYDILSSENNSNIRYVTDNGQEVTVVAQKDKLLHLTNVRRVITSPSKTLTITFKGF